MKIQEKNIETKEVPTKATDEKKTNLQLNDVLTITQIIESSVGIIAQIVVIIVTLVTVLK